jgi:CheY-like chemotaxis protein
MFRKYVEILAACFKDSFESMTDARIRILPISQDNSNLKGFSVCGVIPYQDLEKNISGEFNLGIVEESTAIVIVSEIANKMGLGELQYFDDTASGVLNEFLNIFIGHAISKWDKEGLAVRFGTPSLVRDKAVDKPVAGDRLAYQIVAELYGPSGKPPTEITLTVSFLKNVVAEKLDLKILVVDDSAIMRTIFKKVLEEAGFTIEVANDGLEAIEKHAAFQPDLTIMDLNMPNMGGLDAISGIRETTPEAKFVILTSSSRRDEVVAAITLNVNDYLIKPVKPDELLQRVKKMMDLPA